ncbi:hypothetical protein FNF28_06153 [Cafeteria roenbergensis]|nr:hypothetical protein FNF28_06153 [Cafeteria roenbergensis]
MRSLDDGDEADQDAEKEAARKARHERLQGQREAALIRALTDATHGSSDMLKLFKQASAAFRHERINAKQYYDAVERVLGEEATEKEGSDQGKTFTEYVLRCRWERASASRSWLVARRYSEFDALALVLQPRLEASAAAAGPAVAVPRLPGKSLFGWSTGASVVESRRKGLAQWLNDVLQRFPWVTDLDEVDRFLTLTPRLADLFNRFAEEDAAAAVAAIGVGDAPFSPSVAAARAALRAGGAHRVGGAGHSGGGAGAGDDGDDDIDPGIFSPTGAAHGTPPRPDLPRGAAARHHPPPSSDAAGAESALAGLMSPTALPSHAHAGGYPSGGAAAAVGGAGCVGGAADGGAEEVAANPMLTADGVSAAEQGVAALAARLATLDLTRTDPRREPALQTLVLRARVAVAQLGKAREAVMAAAEGRGGGDAEAAAAELLPRIMQAEEDATAALSDYSSVLTVVRAMAGVVTVPGGLRIDTGWLWANSSHHRDPSSGQRLTESSELRQPPAVREAALVESAPWAGGSTLDLLYSADKFAAEHDPPGPEGVLRVAWASEDEGVGFFPLQWVAFHHWRGESGPGGPRALMSAASGLGAADGAEGLSPRFGRPLLLCGNPVPPSGPRGETVKAAGAAAGGAADAAADADADADAVADTEDSEGAAGGAPVGLSAKAKATAAQARAFSRDTSLLPRFEMGDIMASEEGLWRAATALSEVGAVAVTGSGTHAAASADGGDAEDAVARMARRLGWAVQTTLYGETFTVESTTDPINAAYSPCFLEGHQDLAYYESPPGLQLLHCMRFDAGLRGGESVLVDAVAAGEALREVDPRAFVALATVPVTLQKIHYKREHPAHMVYRRPALAVASPAAMGFALGAAVGGASSPEDAIAAGDAVPHEAWVAAARAAGAVVAASWAPPFEGALRVSHPQVGVEHRRGMAALSDAMDALARSGVGAHCERLEEGTMIVFNNRRMLHGRMSFGPDAESGLPVPEDGLVRRLRGAYVNIDDFQSRQEVLCSQFGRRGAGAHPANGCVG